MSDEIDAQQARDEVSAPYLLQASKRPVGPLANGRCHMCDTLLTIGARFCDAECRDLFEVYEQRQSMNRRKR